MDKYQPNDGSWGIHTVEIIYQDDDFSLTHSVEVRGNCKGFVILDAAITRHDEQLFEEQGRHPVLFLKAPNGEELAVDIDDEDVLKQMCVSVRIVDFKETGR